MAINYDAGSERRGAYANLAKALQTKLDAQNAREAEDIRRKGLFGTGITQENLSSLANTGLAIADFGDKRMQQKMTQAQESFQRRQDDLFKIAQQYQSAGDYENAQLAYEQADMERNRFEDQLSGYREKGILGSRFGSETVGYRRDPEAMRNFVARLNQTNTAEPKKKRPRSVRGGRAMAEANRGQAMMPPRSVRGGRAMAEANRGQAMPQEDEFGGMGTTPLMSQRVMPERGMEGNPGVQPIRNPYSMDTSIPSVPQGFTGLEDPEYIAKFGRR